MCFSNFFSIYLLVSSATLSHTHSTRLTSIEAPNKRINRIVLILLLHLCVYTSAYFFFSLFPNFFSSWLILVIFCSFSPSYRRFSHWFLIFFSCLWFVRFFVNLICSFFFSPLAFSLCCKPKMTIALH